MDDYINVIRVVSTILQAGKEQVSERLQFVKFERGEVDETSKGCPSRPTWSM